MKEAATREDALKMVAPEETAFYGSGLRESIEKDAKNKGAKIDEETKTEVEANTEDIAIEEAQVDRAEGKEATSRKEASGKEDSRSNLEPAGKEEISPKPAVLAALETLKETEETKKSEEPDTPEETDTSEEPGASEETDMPEEPKGSEEEATPSTKRRSSSASTTRNGSARKVLWIPRSPSEPGSRKSAPLLASFLNSAAMKASRSRRQLEVSHLFPVCSSHPKSGDIQLDNYRETRNVPTRRLDTGPAAKHFAHGKPSNHPRERKRNPS
jgi:hypothetical protein